MFATRGVAELKAHPFFKGEAWAGAGYITPRTAEDTAAAVETQTRDGGCAVALRVNPASRCYR